MKIGRLGGIDLHLHWSFWMLLVFHAFSSAAAGGALAGAESAAFVVAVFACVVAHEYGHAAAARYYGIKTSDITVLAFGGIARLVRLPSVPMHEFVIAIAGPLVNVAIALVMLAGIGVGILPSSQGVADARLTFVDFLLLANVILVLFNMLPAFPMDGGRVLRSLLAIRKGQMRATEIAAQLGRWMALVFAVAAFFYGFTLLLIAGFVFIAGTAELMQVRLREAAAGGAGAPGPGFAGRAGGNPFGAQSFQWQLHPDMGGPELKGSAEDDPDIIDSEIVVDAVDVRRIR